MKNVLIIHPKDKSTDFLCHIYKNIPNKTVVTGSVTKDEIIELINLHSQVIMLGHGSPSGLFSVGQFYGQGMFIIDKTAVNALKTKNNNIFIWCNANQFVNTHSLKGLYSGMFISEVSEANYCEINTDQTQINESNNEFSYMLGSQLLIGNKLNIIYDNVSMLYGKLAKHNPVAAYNHARWYMC